MYNVLGNWKEQNRLPPDGKLVISNLAKETEFNEISDEVFMMNSCAESYTLLFLLQEMPEVYLNHFLLQARIWAPPSWFVAHSVASLTFKVSSQPLLLLKSDAWFEQPSLLWFPVPSSLFPLLLFNCLSVKEVAGKGRRICKSKMFTGTTGAAGKRFETWSSLCHEQSIQRRDLWRDLSFGQMMEHLKAWLLALEKMQEQQVFGREITSHDFQREREET